MALLPLDGEHCVVSASRRPSGRFDLVSVLRPLAGEHCDDSASHRSFGMFEPDLALRPLAQSRWRALRRLSITSAIWHSRARLGATSARGWICHRVRTTSTTYSRSNHASYKTISLIYTKCIQLKARNLNNKFLSFHNFIYSDSYNIIVITESWLRPNISEGFIDPKK